MKKTVVFGYHNIGISGIKKLIKHNFEIKLVVTHLDNKNENIWFKSVAEFCKKNEINFIYFEKSNFVKLIKIIELIKPEYIFSFYFRKIFPKEIISLASISFLNMHGSYLPKYRGAAPLNWQIICGERKGGVSLHKVNEKIDGGDIVYQKSIRIYKKDNPISLSKKINKTSEIILEKVLPNIERKIKNAKKQLLKGSKIYKKRFAKDGKIFWGNSVIQINNLIRGVTYPYPGAFTYYQNNKIIIWKSRIDYTKREKSNKKFGYFYKDKRYYKVLTAEGTLIITKMSKNNFLPYEGNFT